MAGLGRIYGQLLIKHPWKTQCITTGILTATGDAIAQIAIEKHRSADSYDFTRTGRFFLFGTVITGPALKTWYMILDKTVKGAASTTMLKKVALDQSLFAPGFCGFFLYAMTLWRTGSTSEAVEKVKQDYWPVLITNYKLWPAAQLFNFYFLKPQYRVLYVNIIAVFWNTYLAWKTEEKPATEDQNS